MRKLVALVDKREEDTRDVTWRLIKEHCNSISTKR